MVNNRIMICIIIASKNAKWDQLRLLPNISKFCKTALKICDVKEISSYSSTLNSDEREYKQRQSLNNSHSERCLNIDSVSFVPCSLILVIKHLPVLPI